MEDRYNKVEAQANYKTIQTVHEDKTRKQKHLKSGGLSVCWGKSLILLFVVEMLAFGGAEGGAVICAAEGSIAAALTVGEDHCCVRA